MGTFGKTEINVQRARLNTCDGKTTEWKSQGLRSYQRRTLAADALNHGCRLRQFERDPVFADDG
jgi:putative transposase